MKKFSFTLSLMILLVFTLTGCNNSPSIFSAVSGEAPPPESSAREEKTYALLAKDKENPYMQRTREGFEAACKEIGVTPRYEGSDQATPEKQIEIIYRLIEDHVDLIAVAANDYDALQPALCEAMDQGIVVISLDSAVNKDSRMLHVNQADPEKIGRVLVQAAYEMIGGEGGMAILSATPQASNQNAWIGYMMKEFSENSFKYEKTPLIDIVYGDDEPTKSMQQTQILLQDERIKIIIAPTSVGMLAAGTYLQAVNSTVKLTGLGLPSKMAPFIEDGTCPWMYLWNPVDLGYLAAYAGDCLVRGEITGAAGDTFSAGHLGEMVVTAAAPDDGGTEVMLGDPLKFESSNIAEWKTVY